MSAVLDTTTTHNDCVLDHASCVSGWINRLMNRKTIDNEAQNKISLIVRDLQMNVPADVVYETLLRRGVFKWLAVRRVLVAAKNVWKDRIRNSIERQHQLRGLLRAAYDTPTHTDQEIWRRRRAMRKLSLKIAEERGYRRGVEQCRAEVRAMCHSPRWQAPDNDRAARTWLDLRSEIA